MPRPRASGAVHMRFSSPTPSAAPNFNAAQPAGGPSSQATRSAVRRRQLCGGCGNAAGRIEASVESLRKLAEIAGQTKPRRLAVGRFRPDLDARGLEQPLDLPHGPDQPILLLCRQRRQQRSRERVGKAVIHRRSARPAPVERGAPHPAVLGRQRRRQSLAFQRAQQAAEIAESSPSRSAAPEVRSRPRRPRRSRRSAEPRRSAALGSDSCPPARRRVA